MKINVTALSVIVLALGLPLWAAVPAPGKPAAMKDPAGPKAISWTLVDSTTPPAANVSSVAADGKIFRIGGQAAGPSIQGWVQRYDPATNLWTNRTSLRIKVTNTCAVSWLYRILVAGGTDSAGQHRGKVQSLNLFSGTCDTSAPAMPVARSSAAASVVDDTMYLFGGNTAGGVSRACYAYNLYSRSWTIKDSMPTARQGAAAVTIGNKIYVFGGHNGTDLSTVEMYDPAANSWTPKTSLPQGRGWLSAVNIGERAYIFGGGSSGYLNTVAVYDPAADTAGGTPWSTDASFTYGRTGMGAAALGNTVYLTAGTSGPGVVRGCVEKGTTDAPVANDIRVNSIEIPPYLGNYGVNIPIYVYVQNLGNQAHINVPVVLSIDSAGTQNYYITQYANLDSAGIGTVIFSGWSACTTPGQVYTMKAWVLWNMDQNAANDTLAVTTEIKDAVWYQSDPASTEGHTSQNFEEMNNAYDCWLIDDFWISGPDSVWLDSVYVRGVYAAGSGPMDSVQVMILPDSGSGNPGFSTPLWTGRFTPGQYGDSSGTLLIRFLQPVKVYGNNPGLWLSVQAYMDMSSSTWGWLMSSDDGRGSYESRWYNPGGGFGLGTGYIPVTTQWPGKPNCSFTLYGSLTPTGVAGNPADKPVAHRFALARAYPNPARGSAKLNFSLDKASQVVLSVYNLAGQKVATVASGSYPVGKHQVVWQGRDARGNSVPGGVYIYRLQAGDRTATGKLIWLK